MDKNNYIEQLKTTNWQKKRLEVFNRDGFKCTACNSENNLQVHHKAYKYGKAPWDYNLVNFVTLCDKCHEHVTIQKKSIKLLFDVYFNEPDRLDTFGELFLFIKELDNSKLKKIKNKIVK